MEVVRCAEDAGWTVLPALKAEPGQVPGKPDLVLMRRAWVAAHGEARVLVQEAYVRLSGPARSAREYVPWTATSVRREADGAELALSRPQP